MVPIAWTDIPTHLPLLIANELLPDFRMQNMNSAYKIVLLNLKIKSTPLRSI